MTSEKIVTIQRGRGAWQGPESKAPAMPTAMRTLPTVTTANASDTPVMCNDAAQLAALGADIGIPISGDMISRDAVLSALNGFLSDPTGRSVFAAIRALPAQPAAPAVKVMPLVWDSHPDAKHDPSCDEHYGGGQNNMAGVNEYAIYPHPCALGVFVLDVMGNRCDEDFATVDAAKGAAQADYEARIMSAFEVTE